jgi:hypothetical protein
VGLAGIEPATSALSGRSGRLQPDAASRGQSHPRCSGARCRGVSGTRRNGLQLPASELLGRREPGATSWLASPAGSSWTSATALKPSLPQAENPQDRCGSVLLLDDESWPDRRRERSGLQVQGRPWSAGERLASRRARPCRSEGGPSPRRVRPLTVFGTVGASRRGRRSLAGSWSRLGTSKTGRVRAASFSSGDASEVSWPKPVSDSTDTVTNTMTRGGALSPLLSSLSHRALAVPSRRWCRARASGPGRKPALCRTPGRKPAALCRTAPAA